MNPSLYIPITPTIDRLCYRYPSALVDAVTELRAGQADRRGQERHGQRGLLPGAFSWRAADAGGPDDRDAGAGRDDAARVSGGRRCRRGACICAAWTTPSSAARWCRAIGCASRSRWGRAARRSRGRTPSPTSTTASSRKRSCCWGWCRTPAPAGAARRPRSTPTAIVHPGARIGAGTVVGPHAVIGEHVRIGRDCRIGASTVIDG